MSRPDAPAEILALVRRHLLTAAPPIDPPGHLATYSPEALLPIGTAITRRRGVDPAAYAAHWHTSLSEIPGAHVGAAFALVDVLDWQPDDRGGRLAAIVSDDRGRPWTTAWVFDGEPAGILAVGLHDGPLPGRAQLLTRAYGELAMWGADTAGPLRCLSPLGIAHHGRTHVDALPLVSLPEARFTCQNRGDCCRLQRWDVVVATNTAVSLAAIPWADLGATPAQVERSEKGYLRLQKTTDGDCHAHVDGGCSIHRAVGTQPIPVCRAYPIHFTVTPDSIAVTASFTCLTAGNNQGAPLHGQTDGLQGRLRLWRTGLAAIPDPVRLWADGPPLAWQTYKDLESLLLDTLADRRLGDLPERVLACSRGLAALIESARSLGGTPAEPIALVRAGMSGDRQGTADAADMLMGRLLRDRPWPPVSMRPFGGWLRSHWSLSRKGCLGADRDDELATRYLRTVLFRKLGLDKGGVALTWGMTAWIAALWDRQTLYQQQRDRVPPDRELQLDTARRLDHVLLNADITELLTADAGLRQMMSNPATWLSFSAVSG